MSLKAMKSNCATCPFTEGGWTELADFLTQRALNEGTPICHSTGPGALSKRVNNKPLACRGARDLQLKVFRAMNYIEDATDEAWEKKAAELGL